MGLLLNPGFGWAAVLTNNNTYAAVLVPYHSTQL